MTEFESMTKIESLIGDDEFKARMREIASVIPQVKERQIYETLFYRNYLFSIDKGSGLTTALECMRELLDEACPFEVALTESPLPAEGDLVRASGGALSSGKCKITCVDISDWMTKTSSPEFKSSLRKFRKNDKTTLYVFRIPLVDEKLMKKIHDDIEDVMFVTDVVFAELSYDNMRQFAESIASESGFSFDRGALTLLKEKIAEERRDGRFYGYDTVGKVVQELIFRKMLRNAGGDASSVITEDDIDLSAPRQSPLDRFDDYVGMGKIKETVTDIVSQIKYLHSRKGAVMPCIHMRFVGNPGTGKTTAARIVGAALAEAGVLREGGFFEYTGRDFVGKYIGETSKRTTEICRAAYGSVLFIDEAYSLFFSEDDSRDFGREALSTLISEMENHRSDMVVIMAGYLDEMDTLMKGNKGLEGRMPYRIEFPGYTRGELSEIFMKMASSEFDPAPGLEAAVRNYFSSLPDSFIGAKEFSNARFVRNLYERCQKAALSRCLESSSEVTITPDDFAAASSEAEFSPKSRSAQIGF